ncbi:Protein Sidekick-1 [Manis pentadactyla]|nr:Protein Sidekick-1 [Manis pentadactyla]
MPRGGDAAQWVRGRLPRAPAGRAHVRRRRAGAQGRRAPGARAPLPAAALPPCRRRRPACAPLRGRGGGWGGGPPVPPRRGRLCPCAEMTHGLPSRHARAQRTATHKGGEPAPAAAPATPRPGRAAPLPARAPPHVAPGPGAGRPAKCGTRAAVE